MSSCQWVDNITIHARVWHQGTWGPWDAWWVSESYLIPTLSGNGTYYIEYWAEDALNNSEPLHNQTICVDNRPPDVNKEYGQPTFVNASSARFITSNTTIYLNATDLPVGCAVGNYTIYYRIWNTTSGWTAWMNTTENQSQDASFTLWDLGLRNECHHYIEYYAVDGFGNNGSGIGWADVYNQSYYVDNTPPDIDDWIGDPSDDVDVFMDAFDYCVNESTIIWINATFLAADGDLFFSSFYTNVW